MTTAADLPGLRVLVVAPLGADARNISHVLREASLDAIICRDLAEAIDALHDAGALVLTEEAAVSVASDRLNDALRAQPPWSDLPLILITSGFDRRGVATDSVHRLGSPHNLTLLERPLRTVTLVATVRAALVARRRQYQLRDLIAERDALLGSLEAQVADRTARLRQMLEELESFSYSVSHDLRAPLRVLDGYARALTDDYADKLDAQARHYLMRISDAAQRMDRLTQDVLAYSQVSRLSLNLQPVALDTLVRDVIEQYPMLAAARDCFHLAPSLGVVRGHVPSLLQCVSNLLENALKFGGGATTTRVQIRSITEDGRVRVFVEDNGPGCDPAQHDRIFGLFERAAPKEIPGTGIGLAIVKKAVSRMGGSVGVLPASPHGCIFWFELEAAEWPEPVETREPACEAAVVVA